MSLLDPLSRLLAAVLAVAHNLVSTLGASPGAAWVLAIALVVVVVRTALLPLAARGVRHAHASARARPDLQKLSKKYANRTDPESLRKLLDERRRITAEHGVPRFGTLMMLAQIPIWMALYHLLAEVAKGHAVGAVGATLVASLGAATLLGAPLAGHGYLGGGWTHLAVVAGLAATAALLSFVTQRFLVLPNTVATDLPGSMAKVQELLPLVSAGSLLVAGSAVPLALLVYWVCNGLWTLVQAAVVHRWFPTPGSPAAVRRVAG